MVVHFTTVSVFALVISFLSILIFTSIIGLLIKRARLYKPESQEIRSSIVTFWQIIRDDDGYPSLSRFQFLLWIVVISFVFFSISLIRISGGETGIPSQLPINILGLVGISAGALIIGNIISRYKYASSLSQGVVGTLPPISSMLQEVNKPVLFRCQMFLWTFLGIVIYLLIFYSILSATVHDVEKVRICPSLNSNQPQFNSLECNNMKNLRTLKELSLPEVDPSLVVIMGFSQAVYLAGKLLTRQRLSIERITVEKKDENKKVTIVGTNFGDSTIFDPHRGMVIDCKIIGIDGDKDVSWKDTIIEIPFPNENNDNKSKDTSIIEVITSGSLSVKKFLPIVTKTCPEDGEKNVSTDLATIEATFNRPMLSSSIKTNTFTLKHANEKNRVEGEAKLKDDKINFRLGSKLSPESEYLVEITNDVKDMEGNNMMKNKSWRFTTAVNSVTATTGVNEVQK